MQLQFEAIVVLTSATEPHLLSLAEVRVRRDLRKFFDVLVCPALVAMGVFIGLPLDVPSERLPPPAIPPRHKSPVRVILVLLHLKARDRWQMAPGILRLLVSARH